MRFFDVHTHLLPQIDDGAYDKEQSKKMISMLSTQNISDIFLTPHFYPYKMSINDFVKKRQISFEQIKENFDEFSIKPYLGAEVYLVDTIFRYEDISELCIDKSSYILTEIPFDESSDEKVISMLRKLCANYSVKPIVAHIERYSSFFTYKFVKELNEIGCLVQFDISSLKYIFLRRKIKKYIKKGLIHLAGTDCHDIDKRKPDFSIMKKYLSDSMIDYLFSNAHISF